MALGTWASAPLPHGPPPAGPPRTRNNKTHTTPRPSRAEGCNRGSSSLVSRASLWPPSATQTSICQPTRRRRRSGGAQAPRATGSPRPGEAGEPVHVGKHRGAAAAAAAAASVMRHPRHAQSQARVTDLRKRLAVSRLRACAAGRRQAVLHGGDIGATADTLAPALRQRLGDEPFVLLAENSLPSAALIAAAAPGSCVRSTPPPRRSTWPPARGPSPSWPPSRAPAPRGPRPKRRRGSSCARRASRRAPRNGPGRRPRPGPGFGTGRGAVLLTSGSGPGSKLPVYSWDACRAQAETVRRLKLSSADRFVSASSIARAYNSTACSRRSSPRGRRACAQRRPPRCSRIWDPPRARGGAPREGDASDASDVRRTVLFATPRMYADLVDAFDSTIASSGPAAGVPARRRSRGGLPAGCPAWGRPSPGPRRSARPSARTTE